MPGPRGTGGGDPDLGPHGLLDGRLPSHLPGQARPLRGTHRPVAEVANALQGGTSSMEEDHRTASQGHDYRRVPGGGVRYDEAAQMEQRVRCQDLLQAGVRQCWCSSHLRRRGCKTDPTEFQLT